MGLDKSSTRGSLGHLSCLVVVFSITVVVVVVVIAVQISECGAG